MASILVVDDELDIRDLLQGEFSSLGHNIETADSVKAALKLSGAGTFDVVFLDIRLPDGSGLGALTELRQGPGHPEIIIMTGYGDPDGAELAVKSGAWDYLEKPVSIDRFSLTLQRVIQYRDQKAALKPHQPIIRHGIIGDSPAIADCISQVGLAGNVHSSVLIQGETGTGKELFARAIHANSARTTRPFVVVDCAALPATLLESILFGHAKGAFTGAVDARDGLIKQADGGTLFLDEVGELPLAVQSTFLRVLQERCFRPVGSDREIRSDFRLVSATNRNLEAAVRTNTFRSDLLYRLQGIVITLPPLRDRREDIKPLVEHYVDAMSERYGLGKKILDAEFMAIVQTYAWPGNIRELVNAMERTISQAVNERILFPIHLPGHIRAHVVRSGVEKSASSIKSQPWDRSTTDTPSDGSTSTPEKVAADSFPSFRELSEKTEENYIRDIIRHTRGNVSEICRLSGLSRANVYRKMKKYGIGRKY